MPNPGTELRATAVTLACQGLVPEAYEQWLRQEDKEPRDVVERLLVAMGASRLGDERGPALADELEKEGFTAEAALVRTMFALAEKDFETSMALEERALAALRSEVFPLCSVVQQIIDMARVIARERPAMAARALRGLLAGAFVSKAFDEDRTVTAQLIAQASYDPELCVAALGPMRTTPHWDESSLSYRWKCLAVAKDPLATEAEHDLLVFRAATPGSFTELLQ
jgi:hypothetical protein